MLSLCLQPDEGIHLRFATKVPGAGMQTRSVDMEFHYGEHLAGGCPMPTSACCSTRSGDAALFARTDEIEMAWRIVDPILADWARPDDRRSAFYEPGSWGPVEADRMLGLEGRAWRSDCGEYYQ